MSTDELIAAIEHGAKQSVIAACYAELIRRELGTADWPRINQAIRDRWRGKTALVRVKEAAWRIAEQVK